MSILNVFLCYLRWKFFALLGLFYFLTTCGPYVKAIHSLPLSLTLYFLSTSASCAISFSPIVMIVSRHECQITSFIRQYIKKKKKKKKVSGFWMFHETTCLMTNKPALPLPRRPSSCTMTALSQQGERLSFWEQTSLDLVPR